VRLDEDVLRAMEATIVHRGPDDAGRVVLGPVGLAMRRLSIVDLAGGHQPIFNETGDIAIVFNGEIYNFPTLRARLVAQGHQFTTHSDTEVIVHLYEELGAECLRELDGMFALALWDRRSETLLLARDRLGEKPLLYAHTADGLVFGSELRALVAGPIPLSRELDWTSVSHYLTYMSVPEPRSILRGVQRLPAGHYLLCRSDGQVTQHRYWDLQDWTPAPGRSEASYLEELGELLKQAVEERLIGDVPIGAFLSGGVDSSVVVALMARASGAPVRTFAVRFAGDLHFDETPFAREVAQQYGTAHQDIDIAADLAHDLLGIAGRMPEPFAVPSALAVYYMAKAAREHVTVVLTGDGGDEVFAGYHRYWWEPQMARLGPLPGWGLVRWLERRASGRPLPRRLRQVGKLARVVGLPPDARYLYSFLGCMTEAEKAALCTPDARAALAAAPDPLTVLTQYYARVPQLSGLARRQYGDLMNTLPGEMLFKTDSMTMAAGLEARPPLIDHQVVEFAARLPDRLRVNGRIGKYLLKRYAETLIPRDLVHRNKHGFEVPLDAWFRGPLGGVAREALLDRAARERGIFDPAGVEALLVAHRQGAVHAGIRIYVLLMLELWCRDNLDSAA
jgi:asparagine synthase (glutamine-hydrolysing)